jgi:nitrate/TMAO reductase-like tetraheme cytochrome c subunit
MGTEPVRHIGCPVSKVVKIALFTGCCAVFCISQGSLQIAVRGQPGASSAPAISTDGKNSCVECHALMGEKLAAPISALQDDVHAKRGLSCAACHGGDPSQNDPGLAMSPRKGFVGKPKPRDVPAFCGKCHSNAEFMKTFNPSLRIDQEAEYQTSVHGKLIRQGDAKPATCISCHGYHGIRAVADSNAPVYPLKVAETCAKCHGDTEYMRPYSIPTDQAQKYSKSVHADALLKKQDLSAPSCNDCHGNHGATPPGVASVANVCGVCHTRQLDLFQKSPHKTPFEAAQMAACVVCHSNHEISHPSDEMIGTGEKSTCVRCHTEGDSGYETAAKMRAGIDGLAQHIGRAKTSLDSAAYAGMEVSKPLFDLKEAEDRLINARVVIHSFSPRELDTLLEPGLQVASKAQQAGEHALNDLQFRRKGLAASLSVILLSVIAIYLKIRQIDSRRRD